MKFSRESEGGLCRTVTGGCPRIQPPAVLPSERYTMSVPLVPCTIMARSSTVDETSRRDTLRRIGRWARRSYLVVIVIGVVVGLLVAPIASDAVSEPESGSVAVVPIEGSITGGNAASVASRLEQARSDSSVEAVVLRINSGGGGAAASEEIYLAVARTAAQKPVVASVNSGALSGAYYAAVPADAIYVKPASLMGSIGVIFVAPQPVGPIQGYVVSGPNKLTGADHREWVYKTESIKNAFVGAVMQQRGDRLQLSRTEVTYAKIYSGSEAVDNGLADQIGGMQTAIARAANLAGVSNYNVKTIGYDGTVQYLTRAAYVASETEDKELISPSLFVGTPDEVTSPQIVMLPPSVVEAALHDEGATARPTGNATSTSGGEV